MILGIGHDICDIRRIEKTLLRHGSRFEKRVFTQAERREAAKRGAGKPAYLAKRFAAKEAVFKAFAGRDQSGMRWHHAEITSAPASARTRPPPQLRLDGACAEKLAEWLPPGWEADIHISLSDEFPLASAFVVLAARPEKTG
jgi:holo-[acyl-carrier protein] synthase